MVRKFGYFEHQCELPPSDPYSVEIPPYFPKFKKWCHSLRRFINVDENAIRTKQFFRSYAAVVAEKKRHAQENPETIHPFSIFAITRERILCFMWLICYITDPITWAFATVRTPYHPLILFQMFLDALFFFNLFVTGFVGYCIPLTKEIELRPRKIFKKRLVTYLLPEFVACLPIVFIATNIYEIDTRSSRLNTISAIKILRCFRFGDFLRYVYDIFYELKIREWVYTWFVLFIINMYFILWSACALNFLCIFHYTHDGLPENSILRNRAPDDKIGTDVLRPENSFHNTFITLLTIATCHFYGASHGYVPIELSIEKLLCSFVIMFGYFSCNVVIAKLLEVLASTNISATKYDELIVQVSEYARSKNLPENVKKRLGVYYEYKFHMRYFKEEAIFANLSEHLRNELILYSCRNVLEKVPLFQGISKGVVGSVLGYMKREIYLPNDVVLRFEEPLTRMFWVSFGSLAVHYGPDCVEILHFEDGDHFGDLSITGEGHNAKLTVIALEITEIYTLSRKDVKHCTTFLKEMSERIMKIGKEKSKLYPELGKMMANEEIQHTVLGDLRKGRILERDRWTRRT